MKLFVIGSVFRLSWTVVKIFLPYVYLKISIFSPLLMTYVDLVVPITLAIHLTNYLFFIKIYLIVYVFMLILLLTTSINC